MPIISQALTTKRDQFLRPSLIRFLAANASSSTTAGGSTMNESLDPKVAARKTVARFEELARDTEVPQAMRDLAERNIAQMRETYERSKDALEGVVQSWERSFDATNQGAVALNRKIIDIAQRN